MNVLMANKFFFIKGGAERCFFNTMRLLQDKDHHVIPFAMRHPENLQSEYAGHFVSQVDLQEAPTLHMKARAAGRMLYSVEARVRLGRLLDREPVDIAHLHNIYHHISPSIIDLLKREGIPVVMTLHDYKLVCPSYSLFSGGAVCEACAGGRYHRAVRGRCTKGSLFKSTLSALEMYLHHALLHIYQKVDVFIAPSAFLEEKLRELGFAGEVVHLPNFIQSEGMTPSYGSDAKTVAYIGRLSQEKGLKTLLQAAGALSGRMHLRIIGDGPQRGELLAYAGQNKLTNVEFLGHLGKAELECEVASAMFTVAPSQWYENNPRSVIESFAMGKPVVGARIGGIPELVREGETGVLFEPGSAEELADKIELLLRDPTLVERLGRSARAFVENELSPQSHYERLVEIYRRAQEKSRGAG